MFRNEIDQRVGQTATSWILNTFLLLYLLSLIPVIGGWVDIVSWERAERRQKQQDEREQAKLALEEERERAEYNAFLRWAKQNPRTVDRYLAIVEHEQISDSEHRAWSIERREAEGPNPLTDLPRLFDWLKSRRELKTFGIEPPLSLP